MTIRIIVAAGEENNKFSDPLDIVKNAILISYSNSLHYGHTITTVITSKGMFDHFKDVIYFMMLYSFLCVALIVLFR